MSNALYVLKSCAPASGFKKAGDAVRLSPIRVKTVARLPLACPLRNICRDVLVTPVTTFPVVGALSCVGAGDEVGSLAVFNVVTLSLFTSSVVVMNAAHPHPVFPSGAITRNQVLSAVRPISLT